MITEQEKNSIKDFVENSEEKSMHIAMVPLHELTELFKELGYQEQEMETNGWQVDFWHDHIKDDQTIQVSGSLVYGDFQLTRL